MKRGLILFCLVLFPMLPAWGQGLASDKVRVTPEAMINGVSEFLVERAQANLIYLFEQRIEESDRFACYFPNTRARLEYGHLQEWLLFPGDIWARAITRDMEIFAVRAVAGRLEQRFDLSAKATRLADIYTTLSQYFYIEFQGEAYPLNVIPLPQDSPQAQIVNGFSADLGEIVSALNVFRAYTATCAAPASDFQQFKASIQGLIHIDEHIAAFRQHLDRHGDKLHYTGSDLSRFCREKLGIECADGAQAVAAFRAKIEQVLAQYYSESGLTRLQAAIDEAKARLEAGLSRDLISEQALIFLDGLKAEGELGQGEMYRLSRAVMFFAQLSDSEDKGEVKAVLKAYTLAPVSYYRKREPGTHLMLTAYLGVAHDFENDDPGADQGGALFAPLGLEYSRGLDRGGSVSLMLAPFDFGYPVTLKLNGAEEDAKFDDIWAPLVALAYGFDDLPLTLGVAYQKGRYVQSLNASEDRALLFLGFDMPLWPLR